MPVGQGELQRKLTALEHACTVKRSILSCIESSLETVQELHGSQENDGIRAQLRERDELAIRLLHTLSQLDSECSQNNACLSKIAQIGSELKAHTVEEIPKLSQDESLCKLRLLKGVILHVAKECDMPWWQDETLAEFMLSMDDDEAP
ncbi:uncharacterized protein MRET_3409 [Malassezia restricta]|uniref:uncharacterized protein n=1 Tax=Malassezia restricta TaxID=76775 RepID=UPI000DD10E99|nr:uncharacterized protein MRET_3409 [Malassezia restricta]AXA51412.1 uncharacterized protein MRET_3409 [Malassezia restricta]